MVARLRVEDKLFEVFVGGSDDLGLLVKELFSLGLHVLGDVGLGAVFEAVFEAI